MLDDSTPTHTIHMYCPLVNVEVEEMSNVFSVDRVPPSGPLHVKDRGVAKSTTTEAEQVMVETRPQRFSLSGTLMTTSGGGVAAYVCMG